MALSDENLQAFINKMLTLQTEKRDKPFTETELKQMALEMGMTEEDWQESRKTFKAHLQSGMGHLSLDNYTDALVDLENAFALNPNSWEAAYGLASAYHQKWKESQEEQVKQNAVRFAQLALQLNPGHQGVIRLLDELREKEQEIKKGDRFVRIGLIAIVALVGVAIFFYLSAIYNTVTEKSQKMAAQWAQVENVYERRTNLLPKLAETVKASEKFERKLSEDLLKVSSAARSVKINAGEISESKLREFDAAHQEVNQMLEKLIKKSTEVGQFQASGIYRDLMAQIEGSDNRISVERKKYNETVREYNTYIQKFPQSLLGFEEKPYLQTQKGVMQSPDLKL